MNEIQTLTLAEICRLNDLSVETAERALENLQSKGLVTGFIAGDLDAPITLTPATKQYFSE